MPSSRSSKIDFSAPCAHRNGVHYRDGRSRDEIEADCGDQYDAWQEDPLTIAPQGGESGIDVLARALPVLRRIVQHHGKSSSAANERKWTQIISDLGLRGR
jgi:hypothetical protein